MQTQTSPKIVRAGEGECLTLRGEIRHQLLDGRDTNGALALARSQFQKGAGAPLHVHTREDEWFCVESGEFEFRFGTQSRHAVAGDVVFGPRRAPHSYTCQSESGELLIGVVGAGFENFFREIAAQPPQTPTSMRDLAASYGVFFDGFESLDAPDAAPKLTSARQSECLEAFGDRARILIASGETAHRFCLAESETPSLCGPPPHLHEREDETFLIRAGRFEFQIGDARVHGDPGDLIFAPRGVAHSFRVVSGEPGRFLLCATPGGFDEFFGTCAALFQSGGVTPQRIGEIGAAHGIQFLVPLS